MSKHRLLFCISIIVLYCINTIESFQTPIIADNKKGECIELIKCPVLYNSYLANGYNENLRKSICGTEVDTVINYFLPLLN